MEHLADSEEWKPILAYEGLYEISNHGRVRSLPRIIMRSFKSGSYPARRKAKILSTKSIGSSGDGYPGLILTGHDGVQRRHEVHVLVATTFLPPPSPSQDCVMHLDDDKLNPHFQNLKWGTRTENMQDMVSKNRQSKLVGEATSNVILTEPQVLRIRQLYADGAMNMREIAEHYDIGLSTARKVIKRITWRHI